MQCSATLGSAAVPEVWTNNAQKLSLIRSDSAVKGREYWQVDIYLIKNHLMEIFVFNLHFNTVYLNCTSFSLILS